MKSFKLYSIESLHTKRETPPGRRGLSLLCLASLLEINPVNLYVVAVSHQEVKVVDSFDTL